MTDFDRHPPEEHAVLLDGTANGGGLSDLPYASDDPDVDEPETRTQQRLRSGLEWAAVVIGALVLLQPQGNPVTG